MNDYQRVLPRDAFNEANLLKCVAQLTMLIEDTIVSTAWSYEYDGQPFDIRQNPMDGSLMVMNVSFFHNGQNVSLWRPLNSRDSWPLEDMFGNRIFNEQGEYDYHFSEEEFDEDHE